MRALGEEKRLAAEFIGTALLLAAVVGSGITASTDGAASAQLFQHTVVVGLALVALILTFGPVSGAHLNPAVTAADWWFGGMEAGQALGYVAAQIGGALTGTVATNLMFGLDAAAWSTTARDGMGLTAAEAVATGGLVLVIFALVRTDQTSTVAGAVGAWIGAAIYFTSSASFANPAVTIGRAISDTYTGIAPTSVPGFLAGQVVGTIAAVALVAWLYAPSREDAQNVVVPHYEQTRTATVGAAQQGTT